ncbi:cobalamin-dependent protein [Hymenobacter sp. YC55]|uniref:cobalamin B12-binding domain-containing protein n=1 Tax=Hymenobacter sp. YC55 TaxID=3034019 RepID=UPI0023F78268|nr:cobalamin-dependent protein [Hymenobacter sp. YC55]MDF7811063.1 cobalamin-dependent protein [Hymenobacter sp. YC55]
MSKVSAQHQGIADFLYEQAPALARAAASQLSTRLLGLTEAELLEDLQSHCQPLADALLMNSMSLLEAHLEYARHVPAATPKRDEQLRQELNVLRQVVSQRLTITDYHLTLPYFYAGLALLSKPPTPLPTDTVSALIDGAPLVDIARQYLARLLAGQRTEALMGIRQAMREGAHVRAIYLYVFQPVQREVGRLWHQSQINVAQEHYCTAATELAIATLHAHLMATPRNGRRLVAATLSGDLHVMPLRIVSDFLESDGWDAYFLGANTPAASVWQAVLAHRAELLVIGASMSHHVARVRELLAERPAACATTRVMVGGAPFNADTSLWQVVGADGWAPDAMQAIEEAKRMFSGKKVSALA